MSKGDVWIESIDVKCGMEMYVVIIAGDVTSRN